MKMGKKFPFFDESPEYSQPSSSMTTKLMNISPQQMHSYQGSIFISCKYKRKVNNSYVTDPLIIKIYKNEIVDEYKPYNKLIYHFQLHEFDGSYYFFCCGMDFIEQTLPSGQKNFLFLTSIKIFDAGVFLSPTHKSDNGNIDIYLLRQICLFRNLNDQSIYSLSNNQPVGFESIQNIISFAISNSLDKCAFGLDYGQVVQISGYPNLVECSEKNLLIRTLQRYETDFHITNIGYADIGYPSSILYATTTKELFYYKQINNEKEELQVLNEMTGSYSGCMDVKEDRLLIATAMDTQILEYYCLEIGPSNFFEGKKQIVKYIKNYILFVVLEDNTTMLAIYDKVNKFFCYYSQAFSKVMTVCNDGEDIFAFVEIGFSQKKIVKLNEKDTKFKFDIFYRRSFFDTALEYAKNSNFDNKKISEIYEKYGNHIYNKGDYQKAIEQYIMTINYLDPSTVIQKYLDASKLDLLILYLEAIHKNGKFEFRSADEKKDYTALLINCYIKQKKVNKLKEFLDGKDITSHLINVETAIQVCKENQMELALSIAERAGLYENYIMLLMEKSK